MRNKLLKSTVFVFLMALAVIVTFFITKIYYTASNDRPSAKASGTDIIDLKIDELKKDVTLSHSESREDTTNWKFIYEYEDKRGKVYIDTNSITESNGYRKAWIKIIHEYQRLLLWEVNCSQRTYRVLKSLARENETEDWNPFAPDIYPTDVAQIPPETWEEVYFVNICVK